MLYHNQFQLATSDALYSDGDRYLPALTVINDLKAFLPSVQRVLVLGTGLGSMVRVMRAHGYDPHFTLVEKDKTILKWAMELLEEENPTKTEPICNDARVFMEQNISKYDLIFIDVFNGRIVPDFVTTVAFLTQCRNSLTPGGHLAFNYIINDDRRWENVKQIFADIYPGYHVVSKSINRILVY